MARAEFWRSRPREEAVQKVLELLSVRLDVKGGNLGVISTRLIEEAASGMEISEDLLLSQQAEAVAERYMQDCLKALQEKLRKQNGDEVRATERMLAEYLASMTAAQKLEMQKALKLESLSSGTLRAALMDATPMIGILAVQAGRFGAYLALTTVMHAVFTSVLGITLPFAAYTAATSALSVVTGPLGIAFSCRLMAVSYLWTRRRIELLECPV